MQVDLSLRGIQDTLTNNILFRMDVQLAPCALLAVVIHPGTTHHIVNRVLWAFCVYLEAVSVMPQLRVMQNTRVCVVILLNS